ncbi:MAG: trigger factor [Ruminococcaceae bacterium]|nr:trigger factor [Oscillospiraceae bacterium]
MLKNIASPEKNVKELELLIEKAAFDKACDKAYHKNVGSINVPGFRKGKAPRNIIEKMYGKGVFYDEAINDLLPEVYTEAVKEAAISPVGHPDFSVESIDENGVVVKVKTFVKPEVELKQYKELAAEKGSVSVSAAEVKAEIEKIRERNAREIDVEGRPAAKDDTVIIDFDGYVDGVAFEGGKAERHSLKLGSGQFIPGFEDQIIGHNVGDEFDVNVEFPKEYHAAELAGKPAVFKIVLHEIKTTELPALDDEFAKDVSEFDTFDEYKKDVKAKLEQRKAEAADREVEGKLIDALIENLVADIPECMYDDEAENFIRDYDNRLQMQGLNLDTYLKYTGSTVEDLKKQFRPQAERQVKTSLALEKIVELENIKAEEADINAKVEELANAYGMKAEDILNAIPADTLANDIKMNKAVDIVKSTAKISTPAKKSAAKKEAAEGAEEKKPAAKKSCAKKTAPKTEEAEGEAKKPAAKKASAKKDAE